MFATRRKKTLFCRDPREGGSEFIQHDRVGDARSCR
jgi:hypothetical protein